MKKKIKIALYSIWFVFFILYYMPIWLAKFPINSVWQYETREIEPDSLVEIMDISGITTENRVYTIRVKSSKIQSEHFKNYYPSKALYYYVDQSTLDNSLTKRVDGDKVSKEAWAEFKIWSKEYSYDTPLTKGKIKEMQQHMQDIFDVRL